MNKFVTMIDGKLICDIAESEGGYNYYFYVGHDGSWIIMRENTAGTEYRYKIGSTGYASAFASRASGRYTYPKIR